MAVDTAWCAPTAAPGVAAQAVKLAVRQLGKGSVSQVRVAICSALLPWALTEHANVRTTRSSSGNRASSQRDDATLWAIMERIGGECGGGTAADLSRACEAFRAELEPLDDETLTAVVRAFDVAMSRAYTWDLRGAAYVIHGGCSTDSFWDFRAGLVSLGRDVFERSLRDPDSLVEIEDVRNRTLFEGFPNVPHEVLESRGLRVPGTTQHPRRLKGRAWSEEELPEKYPRLKAMFGA
ncbi:MAG TPA: DUF4240 domain-containing protein [Planctomycetota bacterium]|nr:DUF4240 domain-containing protein [Planctomycetota bacterium]